MGYWADYDLAEWGHDDDGPFDKCDKCKECCDRTYKGLCYICK